MSSPAASTQSPASDSHQPEADPPPDKHPGRKLACVECRRRKIKCDREHPCLACIVGGRQCELPAPGPPRRPRRRNHHELHDKLANLEALLRQCVKAEKSAEATSSPGRTDNAPVSSPETTPGSSSALDAAAALRNPPGYLVQTPGGVEFRDTKVSSTVFQDLQTIRAILQVETEQATWLPGADTQNPLPQDTSAWSLQDCIPPPNEMVILWRVFLDRADPVTKIIHVPSFRSKIVDAAADFRKVSPHTRGLLFAIFLIASVSLSRQEHWDLLHRSKKEAIAAFSRGFRMVLTQYNYLKNYNLETLRSLTLYSLVQQTKHGVCEAWVLDGLLINMAHRLGMHLDVTQAQISIFEAEMRRRLWWQITLLDVKETAAAGVGSLLLPRNRDARLPLNINDEDLDPSMTEEPVARNGPTDMSYCVMAYELTSVLLIERKKTTSFDEVVFGQGPSASADHAGTFMSVDAVLDFLEEAERRLAPLEKLLCPHPTSDPLHALGVHSRPAAEKIWRLAMCPMEETPEWGTEVLGPEDNFFRIGLAGMEAALDMKEKVGRVFAWYANIDFRMQSFYYLAAQLQNRVAGSMADRAWFLVERTYLHHEELWDLGDKENMTLANLLLVAWERRTEHFAEKRIGLPEPAFLSRLRHEIMMIKAQSISLF